MQSDTVFSVSPLESGKMCIGSTKACVAGIFDGEEEVRDSIQRHLQHGDVAVDIEANFGMHTLIMANQVGQIGKVLAFEPIPAKLKLLALEYQTESL